MSRKNSHNEVSETQAAAARVMRALRWPLLATRGGMLLERLTRAFWPFWSWLFVIWTALAFHLLDQLSVELAYLAMLIGGALVLGFLVIGIRSFRWPSQAAALARLDGSLKGRPLSALADRQVTPAQFTQEKIMDPTILAQLEKVVVVADPEIEKVFPALQRVVVTITTKDGRELVQQLDYPMGDPRNPLSDQAVEEKFDALAGPVLSEGRRAKVKETIWNLEKLGDVKELTALLVQDA